MPEYDIQIIVKAPAGMGSAVVAECIAGSLKGQGFEVISEFEHDAKFSESKLIPSDVLNRTIRIETRQKSRA